MCRVDGSMLRFGNSHHYVERRSLFLALPAPPFMDPEPRFRFRPELGSGWWLSISIASGGFSIPSFFRRCEGGESSGSKLPPTVV